MPPSTSVCLPPATPGLALAVAAPAVPSPGAGTHARNAHVWREIAYFLAGFEALASERQSLVECADDRARKRSAGAVAALSRSIPDGNHGDNLGSIK